MTMNCRDRMFTTEIRNLTESLRAISEEVVVMQDFFKHEFGKQLQEFFKSRETLQSESDHSDSPKCPNPMYSKALISKLQQERRIDTKPKHNRSHYGLKGPNGSKHNSVPKVADGNQCIEVTDNESTEDRPFSEEDVALEYPEQFPDGYMEMEAVHVPMQFGQSDEISERLPHSPNIEEVDITSAFVKVEMNAEVDLHHETVEEINLSNFMGNPTNLLSEQKEGNEKHVYEERNTKQTLSRRIANPKSRSDSTSIFSCSVCYRTFPCKRSYNRHVKGHAQLFSCPKCHKRFGRKDLRDKHLKKVKCSQSKCTE